MKPSEQSLVSHNKISVGIRRSNWLRKDSNFLHNTLCAEYFPTMHKHATVTYLASLVKFKHAILAWCLIKDPDNFTVGQ